MKTKDKPEYASYYQAKWYQRFLMQGILAFYYLATATVVSLVLWAIFSYYVIR